MLNTIERFVVYDDVDRNYYYVEKQYRNNSVEYVVYDDVQRPHVTKEETLKGLKRYSQDEFFKIAKEFCLNTTMIGEDNTYIIESMEKVEKRVKKNNTLAIIYKNFGLYYRDMAEICDDVNNVRETREIKEEIKRRRGR